MYKLIVAMIFLSAPAFAQSVLNTTLTANQPCGHPQVIFQESMEYQEQPLFGGETMIIGVDDQAYWGTMLFTVNQENGYWTLFTFYSDNMVCITASGLGFVPAH